MSTANSKALDDLIKLSTGADGLRSTLAVTCSPNEDDEDCLTMRASDASLDRDGEVLMPEGWQLDNYRRNPVIQNAHNYGTILDTIGRAEVTEVRDGALVQRWRFASEANPVAKIARDLYRGGFLRACSVGFIPVKWMYGEEGSGFRRKFVEMDLLEVSAVPIPSNPNALVAALKSGAIKRQDIGELADFLNQFRSPEGASAKSGCNADAAYLQQLEKAAQDLAKLAALVKSLRP